MHKAGAGVEPCCALAQKPGSYPHGKLSRIAADPSYRTTIPTARVIFMRTDRRACFFARYTRNRGSWMNRGQDVTQ